jgi:uncharacterized delta-60 repeat protein/uncharacterized repeat protein (TIGR02543 family)
MWVLRLASEGTAAGTLDATFGTDGEVALGDNGAHSGNAVAIDANGKIVLVGTYDWSNDTSNAAQKTDIWVQRLNSDGSVDPDFYGNNNIGGASYGGTGFDTGNAVVIQPDDGKIIVVGTYDSGGGNTAAWVQRLDDEGQPSTTFNNGSSIYMSAGIGQFSGNAVVLQDDKKIVVAGSGNITIDGEDTSTVMSLRLHGSSYQLAITSIGSGSVTVAQGQGTLVYDGNIGTENYFPALSPQVVTLTAEPLTGWVFTGWSGDVDCPTTGSCDVTMDSSKNVTATFEMPQLTVITSGAGTGTVTSAPGGITCANGMGTNGCSNTFSSNSEVTLTASLIAWYSVFTGWSGDCVANGLSCVVTMDQLTKTVNAVFADNNNVRLNGAGFYSTLNNAYLAGYAAGIPATIDAQVFSFQENLQLDRAITVSLNGGLGSGFSANAGTSYSTIKGSLKVSAGRLNAKYIKVQ